MCVIFYEKKDTYAYINNNNNNSKKRIIILHIIKLRRRPMSTSTFRFYLYIRQTYMSNNNIRYRKRLRVYDNIEINRVLFCFLLTLILSMNTGWFFLIFIINTSTRVNVPRRMLFFIFTFILKTHPVCKLKYMYGLYTVYV